MYECVTLCSLTHAFYPFYDCDKSFLPPRDPKLLRVFVPRFALEAHSPSSPVWSFPIQTTTHGAKDALQPSQGGWRVKWTFKSLGPTLFVSTPSTSLLSHLLPNQSLSIDSISLSSHTVKIISLSPFSLSLSYHLMYKFIFFYHVSIF